ncbi:MAG TPA: SDR family NAD(P)-dependent oxidoreductase [Myxococcaceae bacterium]|jgi:3-oxoacyl-[acyl-carrier protein] reductase
MRALEGRVAVVTGSSRGIGAAIARRLADEGAEVAVHGRDRQALSDVAEVLRSAGHRVLEVGGDVTSLRDVEAMAERVAQGLGPVDILVANAGANFTRPGIPLEEIEEADWRASVDANLTATFLTLRTFLPGMKKRGGGSIVTLSSAAARRPTTRSPVAYGAAKAGIELLTRQLAAELGPSGIRINCVAPETILTERNLRQILPEVREQLAGAHPIRRLGTPEDVASAVLYLVSDASGWVSGVVLDVAGGSVLA